MLRRWKTYVPVEEVAVETGDHGSGESNLNLNDGNEAISLWLQTHPILDQELLHHSFLYEVADITTVILL